MKKLLYWHFFLKNLFSLVIAVSVAGTLDAQTPTITSFTPTSGQIGTAVTITGSNFSPTAANNIVWFGAVKTTVTAATSTTLSVIVPTGATYQPISVTNVTTNLTAYSSTPFKVTFPSSQIIDATAFAAKVDFTAGTDPWNVAIGDIDGDGKPDLAVVNYTSNTISIYRNTSTTGSIVAGSFAAKVDFTTGTTPQSIAIGDIDGDGKPDLVVTNGNSNSISVFRNTSTSGSITSGAFAAKVDFTTGTDPYGVAIGDIDGDGKPDLVVTNDYSNTVSIFRNTGTSGSITTGSFATKVDFTTGTNPTGIAIIDIDGDGKPDLAVANYNSSTVSVLRNTSTSGSITSGSFAAKVDFTTGSNPRNIAIGDIDGDGKPDLAVANEGSNTVSAFRNTSTAGSITTGSFTAKVDFTAGTGPEGIAISDFDGDGKPDLAVANEGSNTVSIFRNTSISGSITTGSFAAKVDFTAGTGPYFIAIDDIDGDGKPDLAVINGNSSSVSVLRNTISGPPIITSFVPTSGPIGTAVTITGTNFSPTAANNIVWFGAVQATVTAATATQLTVTVPTGTTYAPFTLTVSGLTDYSAIPFNVTFPSSQVIDATAFASKVDFATGTYPTATAIGDIDGDGKPDLVVVNSGSNSISVYRNTSTLGSISGSSFAAKVDFTTGTGPIGVAIGDLDGDGKPDIVVTNELSNTISVFRNISTSGTISLTRVDFTTGTYPYCVAIGDIDGDGKPDLAVTNNSSNTVSLFRNTSTSGSITTGSFGTKVDFATGSYPNGIVIGDIDGDGKPDLAVANSGSYTLSIFRNTSTTGSITTSSLATKVDFGTGNNPYYLVMGDIDGDGKPDLAVTNTTSYTISVFRNTSTSGSIGTGSFAAKVDFTTGTSPYSIGIVDFDGDGKADMAVANYAANTVSVFRNTSTSGSITASSFATKVDFTTGTNPFGLALGDIDGDGKPDLAITNYSSNTVSIFRNTISGPLPPVITSFAPTSGPIGTVVNITGTNFSTTASNNIVWFGAVQATVTSATATQLSVTVPTGATYVPFTVTINGLTDYSASPFNVTFPSSQVIDATAFATKVDFTTSINPTCTAIGDIDGDGKADIVVANSSSNTISVFRNTSSSGSIAAGSFAARVDFTTGTNPYGVVIGDIDGDGKPDLVVVNNSSSGSISVFRNTSTSGSITTGSLAAKVDFSVGANPIGVAIGDIDGDGKPDLAVTNLSSNTVSVFRNTGTSGAITTGSFAAKVDFITGSSPTGLTIVDIDGDGKPELAVTNSGSSSISVFRNTSTSGAITSGSFAAKVDFTTGTSPYNLVFGDIDGDGKPDLAVANQSGNTVSVFRNTSTTGSITTSSLAAKVDFATGTSPYCIAIGDMDGDGKPDLAVPNYTSNTISIIKNTSTSGSITTSSFATKVDFTTGTNPYAVIICDIDGDGKPDLAVTNYTSTTISVLRNTITGPPIISSFTPTSGSIGTAVTIAGANFSSTAANNIVWFGAVQATVTAATTTQLTVTVPTGATYQPITVTINGLTDYSGSPFKVTFPTSQVIDATSLAAKVDFTTGSNPYFAALGDIDGDGKVDLVVTNSSSNTISIYRNISTSGSIVAGSFVAKVDFATGTTPNGIAIGDIDGDGKLDIAITNYGSNTISVFRNTATSGAITSSSLATKVDFTTGTNPNGIVIGDIDGDGKPEIITVNTGSNTVSVFRNTSTSGAITTSSFSAKVDFAAGSIPFNLAIFDIDGDGKPDLAVANQNGNVSVFRNTSSYGSITSGSFAAKVDFTAGTGPTGLISGDIDGDGKPDIAVTNQGSNTVSILRNTSTSGSITTSSFATKVDFTTATGPYGIAICDIDGDGKPDLAVACASPNLISILRNTSIPGVIGTGSLAAKVDFTAGTGPEAVVFGDIDGDGKPDLTVANTGSNTVSVFRNAMTTLAIPTITSFTPTSGPIGRTITITGTNFSTTAANNIVWFGAVKATVSAATATQLTVTVPMGATYQPITVTVNGLTAYTSAPFNVTFASSQIINSSTFNTKVDFTTGSTPYYSAIGDIDGDGKPDLVVVNNASNTVSVYRNTSSSGTITAGSFAAKVDFATGTGPYNVAIGDIDGDGKPDLVVVNYGNGTVSVFRNTATSGSITSSSFAAKVDFSTGSNPTSVAIGDIDGDDKPDLAVTNNGSSTVSIFRNTSASGTITSGSLAAKVDFTTGSAPYSVAVCDLDGDGKNDLVVTNISSNSVSVFRNTSSYGTIGAGSFAAKVDFTTGSSPYSIAVGDIDGDGKPDLAVTNYGSSTISLFRNTSVSGAITAGSFTLKVDFASGNNPVDISIGDFDGDGKPDLTVSNYTDNTVSVFKNISTSGSISTGSFASKVDLATGTGTFGNAIGDIDGDGRPDIVSVNSTAGTLSVIRNNIALKITISSFTPTSGAVGTTVTITGTNFSPTAANNIVWFGATKATVTAATATQLTITVPTGATYQPITVTTGGVTAYSSSPFNVTFSSSQIIDANALATKVDFTTGSVPYAVAIGDIDGDGKADLVVTNSASNTISVFRNTSTSGSISSGSFASKVDFATGSYPYFIAIGDIDGDGKPDIVITNSGSNTISVFRNTATSGSITASSLSAKVDFTTGTSPSYVAIADIDGDGKPEIAVTNTNSNTVSIFQNTSASGSITTGSFAAKVDFITGTNPTGIAINDLDGDGKPDLAITNNGANTLSVFRNTSTFGSISAGSFAAKVDYTTGSFPYGIAISDIDGDGKADIVVANEGSGTVSLFRNVSTTGSITIGSFAAKVDFTTGSNPYGVAVGDIDGDGKPDITVANYPGNSISVFRNKSTSGSITTSSLASKVDFSIGSGPFTIAIGDIDGDGKPDLSVANYYTGNISVLRNTMVLPPTAPTVGIIIQPTCKVTTGSVILGGLPSSGTWTVTRSPGGTTTSGSGTSVTVSGIPQGTYTFTVTGATGGTSLASANVIINAVPTGIVPIIKSKWGDILICYNLKDSIATYQWYKASAAISGATSQYYVSNKQAGTYKVQTTDENGCTNFSNTVQITGTKSFSVYPNPAKENFAIKLNDETLGKAIITITNATGTKVMEVETKKESDDLYQVIPVTNLDQGVYYVKVTVNQVNVYFTKIVVLK